MRVLARVRFPYQPSVRGSQTVRIVGVERMLDRIGSVMSQIIHILPSRGRGGVPVKRWVGGGVGVLGSVVVVVVVGWVMERGAYSWFTDGKV